MERMTSRGYLWSRRDAEQMGVKSDIGWVPPMEDGCLVWNTIIFLWGWM